METRKHVVRKRSIRSRIRWFAVVAMVVPIVIVAWMGITRGRAAVTHQATLRQRSAVRRLEDTIIRRLEVVDGQARLLAQSNLVAEAIDINFTSGFVPVQLVRQFNRAIMQDGLFDRISVYDTSGVRVATAGVRQPLPEGVVANFVRTLPETKDSGCQFSPALATEEGSVMLAGVVVRGRQDSRARGSVVIEVPVQRLLDADPADLDSFVASTFLLDHDGKFLHRGGRGYIESTPELRDSVRAGESLTWKVLEFDGSDYAISTRPVAGQPWVVGRVVPLRGLERPIAELARDIAVLALLVVVIGTVIGSVYANRIVVPLRELGTAIERVTAGEHVALRTGAGDELEFVANAFNNMVAQLDQAETYTAGIFQSISDALIVIDTENRIERVNPATCTVAGRLEIELIGQMASTLFAPEASYEELNLLERIRAAGPDCCAPMTAEVRFRSAAEEHHTMSFSAAGIWSPDGELLRVVAVARDMTEIQRTMRVSQLAVERAEQASLAKSEFLANMSHEMRTPMHAILSFAQFGLKRSQEADRDKLKSYFDKVDSSARHLLHMLNDLLDLSRLELGNETLDLGRVDLEVLIQSVVAELEMVFAERGVTVRVDIAPAAQLIGVDPNKLMQVVRNLLANAARFSPEAGLVEVTAGLAEGRIRLAVMDRGVGVPPAEAEIVFEEFVQSSRTRNGAGGTGLGLAICRQIVELHGGAVWVQERLGGGAHFVVELPYRGGGSPNRTSRRSRASTSSAASREA